MRIKKPLTGFRKKARRGIRGYPLATIAYYGPNLDVVSKVAVRIIPEEDAEPSVLERWFSDGDVQDDPSITAQIEQFIVDHGAKSVVLSEAIIGCPHEGGVDYSDGEVCTQGPFWVNRDRWTGEIIQ